MSVAKPLGFWALLALVAGNMIGSGIFLLPSSLAALGSVSLWSWVFSAIGAMLLAWVFAKMSMLVDASGGPYAYAQAGFGHFIGYQMAFYYWVSLWVGNAAIAIAFASYAHLFFPVLEQSGPRVAVAIGLVWLLTIINCIGVRQAGILQVVCTILKLIPIILVGVAGWFYVHSSYILSPINFNHTNASSFSVFGAGVALTLWAFVGVESATVPADCAVNPKRNIPLATMLGTLLAAIVYIASSVAIFGMIPAQQLAQSLSPFADAAEVILGPWGGTLIGLGAVISCFGALNGWTLLAGQVGKSAAKAGFFPKFMAKGATEAKADLPVYGLLISAGLITILLLMTLSDSLVEQFNLIILIAVIGVLIPYLFTCVALLIVQRRKLHQIRLFDFIAVIGALIYVIWAILGVGLEVIFYSMIFFVFTVLMYIFVKNKKS